MSNGDSVEAKWVAARYEGEKGKYVASLAKEGVGYFELESGAGWILVAFRRVGEIEPHLTRIGDLHQISRLEQRQARRVGTTKKVAPKLTATVNQIFFGSTRKDLA